MCDCIPKCLLCKQSGHTAHDKGCSWRGDFAPPCLPWAAPVEVQPPIEDALKVAAIPHTHCARPVKGGGGSKGKAKVVDVLLFPQEGCAKNDEVLALLFFCCPMMQFADYQQLYVGKEFISANTPKLADSKDIIQLHLEFTIRKNNGEDFTRRAQRDFLTGFHSDAELADIISRAALSIDHGSGHKGPSYLEGTLVKDHWLESMGNDPEDGAAQRLIAEADNLVEGWTKVMSSKGSSTPQSTPLPPPATPPVMTEYSWMLGGKLIPLGFAAQPLGPPSGVAGVDEPSETVPYA
jgi:hypothetical protein